MVGVKLAALPFLWVAGADVVGTGVFREDWGILCRIRPVGAGAEVGRLGG